jgi:hypothetical protein
MVLSDAQAAVVFANMHALCAVCGLVTWWLQALEGNCSAAQTAVFAM